MSEMDAITPGPWLDLGVAGAALFIVLVLTLLIFKQQSKSIDKLCSKIDDVVMSFAENNLKLNEVIISNDKDQHEVLRVLSELHDDLQDMQKRVVRIDTRLESRVDKHAIIETNISKQ